MLVRYVYDDLRVTCHGRLPPYDARLGLYFITARLADSLPRHVEERLNAKRTEMLRSADRTDPDANIAINRRIRFLAEKELDRGAGSCYLRRDDVAALVLSALRFFDEIRYRLLVWSIMPSHFHVILRLLGDSRLAAVLQSLQSYSSHEIGRLPGCSEFRWQKGCYDSVMRDSRGSSSAQRATSPTIRRKPHRQFALDRLQRIRSRGRAFRLGLSSPGAAGVEVNARRLGIESGAP